MQLLTIGIGQVGGEIGKTPWVIKAGTVQEELDFLAVEWVDLNELLEGGQDRHRVGTQFRVDRKLGREVIAHPCIDR